jgi:hypothetical protein
VTYIQKLNLRLYVAVILTIVGSGLLIAGFIVPPLGIIDNSVLVAFGETCTFIAALLGIDYNYKYKVHKHKIVDSIFSYKQNKD